MTSPSPRKRLHAESSGAGVAIVALACTLAAVGATQLLLDSPRSRERLSALWPGVAPQTAVIATIAAPPTPYTVAPTAVIDERRDDVTGSISPVKTTSAPIFGVDVGGGETLRDIKRLWAAIGPQLGAAPVVQPMLLLKENAIGGELRLVIGPFAGASDLAALCDKLRPRVASCVKAPWSGQIIPAL